MAIILHLAGPSRFSAAEIRMTIWGGALLGLLGLQAAWWTLPAAPTVPSVPAAAAEAPDPWAESRRSAALLAPQERAPAHAPGGASSPAAGGDLTRLRVVDGDTFWLGGEKIRIADIDTPETHPPRCAREAELGARATRRLEALLMEAPFELTAVRGRDEDGYGRKLRIVTRGGRSLGDVLVAEGLARTWTGRREPWCAAADAR